MQLFVIINNVGRCECKKLIDKMNMKEYVIKNLFGILVIVSVNVIIHVILVNIWTMKIINAEKIKFIFN